MAHLVYNLSQFKQIFILKVYSFIMDSFDPKKWLEDTINQIENEKYIENPYLEILNKLKNSPNLIYDYKFHYAILHESLNLSQEAFKLANELHLKKISQENFFIQAIKSNNNFQQIVDCLSWKWFEYFVELLLKQYSWLTTSNFRFKSVYSKRSNLEIDVIAYNKVHRVVLLIDCKRYKNPMPSNIVNAAEKQLERLNLFQERLPDLMGVKEFDWLQSEKIIKVYPLLITWRDHQRSSIEIDEHTVLVVEIKKFKYFLETILEHLVESYYFEWSII
jgi:hypothetical protein